MHRRIQMVVATLQKTAGDRNDFPGDNSPYWFSLDLTPKALANVSPGFARTLGS